jgi:hypothetical protein
LPCCWINTTAPGNFPVAISLLKNSVMRASLSGEGARAAAARPGPAAVQITIEATANIVRAGREVPGKPDFLCANIAMIIARAVLGRKLGLGPAFIELDLRDT